MSNSKGTHINTRKNTVKKYIRRRDAFNMHIFVEPTNENFVYNDVYNDMTVAQLRSELEYITGLPDTIQRLSYLDEGDLQDHSDVKNNDIVPGSTLKLRVWDMYQELIKAVTAIDSNLVFKLGVTRSSDYYTPASDYMTKQEREEWLEERAFIALCVAAHRGHEELVVKLIENGADVNRQTSTGKTPLHLAAAVGNEKMVNRLLSHGADISIEDQNGNTPMSVAERFGNKVCSKSLFQFQWQERRKNAKPSKKVPLFAHQYFDSSLPVWKRGSSAQIYVAKILKPGEFEGTDLSAPKAGRHPSAAHKQLRDAIFFGDSSTVSSLELTDLSINKEKTLSNLKKPLTHQEWLQKQKETERSFILQNKRQTEECMKRESDKEIEKEDEKFGYEKWLEEQAEWEKSSPDPSKDLSTPDRDGIIPVHHDGALRTYLRSLGKSSSGVSYEDWLNEKEKEINQLVQEKSGHMPISS